MDANRNPTMVEQDVFDRGIELFKAGKVRPRLITGTYAVRSGDFRYRVDIRPLLDPDNPDPQATCIRGFRGAKCHYLRYHPEFPCKHIVAATYHATLKGLM